MPDLQRHDTAVVLCCDRNFLHLALFVARQVLFHNPFRRFDVVISVQEDIDPPAWAVTQGVIFHRTGSLPPGTDTARFGKMAAALYRLTLVRDLGGQYRRLLYLDSDVFVEGGDFSRLLEVDIGPHAIGAVLDAPFFYEVNHHAREYQRVGLPALPYMNTGLQLIDCASYRDQEVAERSLEALRAHPDAIILLDQSMTNIALRGKFALLAPCWNWQLNGRFPLIPKRYPVFMRHFITAQKPDRDSSGWHEARFNQAYRDFMTQFTPDRLAELAPPCDPAPMSLRDAARMLFRHVYGQSVLTHVLRQYPDSYKAVF